jgi:uncharacterized protein with FMN-binding domain
MRRIVVVIASTLTGLVLLFSYPTSLNRTVGTGRLAAAPAGSGGGTAVASTGQGSGTFTGTAAPTPYGNVQVQITVAAGKITDALTVDYPSQNGHDQQINAYALPILQSETVQAQSSSVDMVSGATYTSQGYVTSLQSAIDQAGL